VPSFAFITRSMPPNRLRVSRLDDRQGENEVFINTTW
jgi:hypothetical protein